MVLSARRSNNFGRNRSTISRSSLRDPTPAPLSRHPRGNTGPLAHTRRDCQGRHPEMASEHNNTHEPGTCPMLWRHVGVMVGDNVSVSTGFHRKLTPLPPEPPHPWRRGRLRGRSTAGRWPSPPYHSPEEPYEQPGIGPSALTRPPVYNSTTPPPPPRTIRYVQHPDEGRAFYVQADLGSGLPSSSGRRTPAPPCGSSRPRRGAPR